MQNKTLVSAIGALSVVFAVAACSKAPEPAPAPQKMTSDELDRSVTARINDDASLVAYKLDVDADADKNTVTISGKVPTEGLRMKAIDAAKSVNPSLVITDKIDVKPGDVELKDYTEDMAREARAKAAETKDSIGDSLEDAWLHTKIRAKLLGEGEFPGGSINVDVKNDVVTLRGSVATAAEKTKAGQIAKEADGVKSVRNQLVVKPAK